MFRSPLQRIMNDLCQINAGHISLPHLHFLALMGSITVTNFVFDNYFYQSSSTGEEEQKMQRTHNVKEFKDQNIT